MKTIPLGKSGMQVPTPAVGCMRLCNLDAKAAEHFIATAVEEGAVFFDHADIYGGGACEEIFARAIHMNAAVRENIFLQSKCGIRPGVCYDLSKDYILKSVDGSLKRLNTEYLDVLLLHRPDALTEPEEVAQAFEILHSSGKVRHFGVSNQNPMQMQLLQKFVKQPLAANQLQLSPTNATMISQGLHVNMLSADAVSRDGSVLDFCRLHDITVQVWSPFQYGTFDGTYLGNEKFPELNRVIREIGEKYALSDTAVVMAWLLRHPAKMQPIVGTTNEGRLRDCIRAAEITLSREEWYKIYLAAGNTLP